MAKVKGVTIFLDSDGGEHDTAKEADRENELIEARHEFREAAQKLSRAFLNTAVTGCGRSFDDVASGHYWEVRRCVQQRPFMRRVWIWPHACDVDRDGQDVRYRGVECDERGKRTAVDVRISDLYATDKAARQRYRDLFREYANEVSLELAELKGGE